MRRNILSRQERIIKKKGRGNRPIIYIRYLKDKVMYIGESRSYESSRHLRDESSTGDYDVVRCLNAPRNKDLRRKWEAKLICWLKPETQDIKSYLRKAKLDYRCATDMAIIRRRNTEKILNHISKKYNKLSRLYEKFLNYDLKHVKKMDLLEKEPDSSKLCLWLSGEDAYKAQETEYRMSIDTAVDFTEEIFFLDQSIKMISKLPEGVIAKKVIVYINQVSKEVKKMFTILHALLKQRGVSAASLKSSVQIAEEHLPSSEGKIMKHVLYGSKILTLQDLYGVPSLLKNNGAL